MILSNTQYIQVNIPMKKKSHQSNALMDYHIFKLSNVIYLVKTNIFNVIFP